MLDGETYECVKSFFIWMDEVSRAFAISDIQSFPVGDERSSVCRSSMTYGSETRPLLVEVGLKFERAEMQMIRWMCGSP